MKEAAQAKSMNSMEEVTMFLGFYSKRKKVIHKLHTLSVLTCNKYIANSEPSSQAQNNYPIWRERSTRVNRMHPELLMQMNRSYAGKIHAKQISSTMKRMNPYPFLYPFLNEPYLLLLPTCWCLLFMWPTTDRIVSTSNGHKNQINLLKIHMLSLQISVLFKVA